jgi:hypothetical protein
MKFRALSLTFVLLAAAHFAAAQIPATDDSYTASSSAGNNYGTQSHSRLVSVPRGLHLPWRLIIRRFELSDKTYSKTNFEPAIRGSVRRVSGLVVCWACSVTWR